MSPNVLFALFAFLFVAHVDCVNVNISLSDDPNMDWPTFKQLHNKSHHEDPVLDAVHKTAFLHSQQIVLKHNEEAAKGNATYTMALTKFADYTPSEYAKLNGLRLPATPSQNMKLYSPNPSTDRTIPAPSPVIRSASADSENGTNSRRRKRSIPASLDWRNYGYVTPVKNQGGCGSCWAFASTGALESQFMKKNGKLPSLSEQNLIDCTSVYLNFGCSGGWMANSWNYIKANKGIDSEASYPYKAANGACNYKAANSVGTDYGYTQLRYADEWALMTAVAQIGPIAVGIQVTNNFGLYKSGVFYDPSCTGSNSSINHAVLIVGYGTDSQKGDYWIVKNSWGTGFGESGYIRMARNRNNNCGIASWPVYPNVWDGITVIFGW